MPALRERREDIALLASHFAVTAARRIGAPRVRLDEEALSRLVESDWPGNVRELENVVARAVLRAAGTGTRSPHDIVTIAPEHLDVTAASPAAARPSDGEPAAATAPRSLRVQVAHFERRLIVEAIARADGNWAAAARALGMHRSNLHHLAARLGLRERA